MSLKFRSTRGGKSQQPKEAGVELRVGGAKADKPRRSAGGMEKRQDKS